MTHEEFASAVDRLDMTLEEIAREINQITGQKTKGIDLSRMKKGKVNGGRDPTPVVATYMHFKMAGHNGGPVARDAALIAELKALVEKL